MGNRQRSGKGMAPRKTLAAVLCVILALIFAWLFPELGEKRGVPASNLPASGELEVIFLDVGQADCILIRAPEKTVLIDAGDLGDGDRLVGRLKKEGVSKIDLLIATHPHADHIGGMPEVVEAFPIGEVLFGDVPEEIIPTTKVYERLLDAIEETGTALSVALPEESYNLGGGSALTILGPLKEYGDLNNTSVVCRLSYGETSFLFTGDAEAESEADLLDAYPESALFADVLKLGHHGSHSSSTPAFLKAVGPSAAVAMCGEDNSYGHPHEETLDILERLGISLYRTDLQGTVRMISDGSSISLKTERADPLSSQAAA